MKAQIKWTEALDERLRMLRADGLTWDQIALELEMTRNTAIERGRRLGARPPPRCLRLKDPPELQERPSWPPGHPVTWGLLITGTCLAGEPYPYPVFL